MRLTKNLQDNILLFDGAMGTTLQANGLTLSELPEIKNITEPHLIKQIHEAYIGAGAQVITTNTFGANGLKLANSNYSVEAIVTSAITNAQQSRGDQETYIALGIGPLGALLEPMGTLSFKDAYLLFQEQIQIGSELGVDLILIETMTCLAETRAAILAAKEHSNLPIFCTMSFEANGRTFTGCTIPSMVMVLEGLGVDALGVNCSLGPKELIPIVTEILQVATIPVMVQANAGLPTIMDGKTSYGFSPNDFASYGKMFAQAGVQILGGCCGTTPDHIQALKSNLNGVKPKQIRNKPLVGVCSSSQTIIFDGVKVIGERINPTGKKHLKEALVKGDLDLILREAIQQVQAGADVLDINVSLPEIDEVDMMTKVIREIQGISDVPLQIDSTNPQVLEQALRIYQGKAIVNSVSGEEESLQKVLPLVKKYGAAVIGLTLDENGIPATAEGRLIIAEKIVQRAKDYGIDSSDVYIDCLVLTAAAQQSEVQETLRALKLVKEKLNVKTVLGISNCSFGLPDRELLNTTFLAAALYAGLDLPIVDPLQTKTMDVIQASNVLWNKDLGAESYLKNRNINIPLQKDMEKPDNLADLIKTGHKQQARQATRKLLTYKKPLQIIVEDITPALDWVGQQYERGIFFLPQLIRSAETVQNAFEVIKKSFPKDAIPIQTKGPIVLATVQGDIHDIGKNIVKVLLENYNYEIIDLGKDVPVEQVVTTALQHNAKVIGLSALMTTTVKNMEATIRALKLANPEIVTMVGGAVLTSEYAKTIGADFYARDAKDAITIAKKILG